MCYDVTSHMGHLRVCGFTAYVFKMATKGTSWAVRPGQSPSSDTTSAVPLIAYQVLYMDIVGVTIISNICLDRRRHAFPSGVGYPWACVGVPTLVLLSTQSFLGWRKENGQAWTRHVC